MFLLVSTHPCGIQTHRYLLYLRKAIEVDDGQRGVVAVREIPAGISDIEPVVYDTEFIGLVSYFHLSRDLQRSRIYLIYRT